MKAIRVHEHGGAEVLRVEDIARPEPKSGEVLVRVQAAGVNFLDVYQRTGLYPQQLPITLGQEGSGVVEQVGPDVDSVTAGDLVAWAQGPGSCAEFCIVRADRVIEVPAGIDARIAAAVMLQGMTAHYLATLTYPLQRGDWCLVHAAAGGVGLLLCQMARLLGARVIGTTSTEEKAQLARAAGADEIVLYTREDVAAAVKRITDGAGVAVVYDSVGRTTFEASLDSLRPRGTLALFGQSSGPVLPLDPQVLNRKGSLYLTRPSLNFYTATRAELSGRAADIMAWLLAGKLTVRIDRAVPLEEAAAAHRALEARETSGKVLLIP